MGRKRHQKRVTVGRRFGDYVRAYYATRAGPVVDDDLLAERRFELLCDYTRKGICITARARRDDETYRPAWITLASVRRLHDHDRANSGKEQCNVLDRAARQPRDPSPSGSRAGDEASAKRHHELTANAVSTMQLNATSAPLNHGRCPRARYQAPSQ